mgnify:CR=1 FL=1
MAYAPTGKIVGTNPIADKITTQTKPTTQTTKQGNNFANLIGDVDRLGKQAESAIYRADTEKDLLSVTQAVNQLDTAVTTMEAVIKKATDAYNRVQEVLK